MPQTDVSRQPNLERLGFRFGAKGTHSSRNMMLDDLTSVFEIVPAEAERPDYQEAIVEKNVLGKPSGSSRLESYKNLAALYGFDPGIPLYRYMRFLWNRDRTGRPLIAFITAFARDPLLRVPADVILDLDSEAVLHREEVYAALEEDTEGRFNESVLEKVVGAVISSWSTAGYLESPWTTRRTVPEVSPGGVAMALFAGYLEGLRGERLLTSQWRDLVDTPSADVEGLALEARRRGWLNYRAAGGVVEVTFSDFLTEEEERLSRESG